MPNNVMKLGPKKFFSARDLSELLECGVSTIWRWAKDGTIPKPIKIGGMTRWRRAEILDAFPELEDLA